MSRAAAKPYRRPRLTRYGRLEAVTTGGTGGFDDGKSAMTSEQKKMAMGAPLGGAGG